MANIKSAEKRWRQSLKRRLRNRAVRTATRTQIKTVNRTIGAGEPSEDALKLAIRSLDKAAEKGIIHPNNAARRKSRLMHRFATAVAGPSAAAPARTTRSRATGAARAAATTRAAGTPRGAATTRTGGTRARSTSPAEGTAAPRTTRTRRTSTS